MLSTETDKPIPAPYFDDPCEALQQLRHLGDGALLDSGANGERGRFDIIAAGADKTRSLRIYDDCTAAALRASLATWQRLAEQHTAAASPAGELPFYGGYIGHFSYELGRRLQGLPPAPAADMPIAVANYYPWALVQDREAKRSWLVGEADALATLSATLLGLLDRTPRADADARTKVKSPAVDATADNPTEPTFALLQPFEARWSQEEFGERFRAVKRYIAQGDCYQINVGQPFSTSFRGDLFLAYRHLRRVAKAPFSGFFTLDAQHDLLSLSPERFLTVDQSRVETRPIKGTRPRHGDPLQDRAQAAALLASDKERAENLMIVDLLRNDIGRFCVPGSVHAKTLFALESYATVHHLVSVVTGTLTPEHSPLNLLLGCLPGGSITGAPKRRAMQIIDELEAQARQQWCGSLFYLSRHGRLDSNISIRTLFNDRQQLHCWAGGGLVDDSRLEAEYQEQRDKVGAFLHALEMLSFEKQAKA